MRLGTWGCARIMCVLSGAYIYIIRLDSHPKGTVSRIYTDTTLSGLPFHLSIGCSLWWKKRENGNTISISICE